MKKEVDQENEIHKGIETIYVLAEDGYRGGIDFEIPDETKKHIDFIVEKAEASKAVLTVLVTSLFYKHLNPDQDIRLHQKKFKDGYSGRSFDAKYITPFMKEKRFPAMVESGWLTRSLEQHCPYDKDYTGSMRLPELKDSFLELVDKIESGEDCEAILFYLLGKLIAERDSKSIELAKPTGLTIDQLIKYLSSHFDFKYQVAGASRLPVLALYAIYECLINEAKRFQGKTLLPLENHTSADSQSGNIGDIAVVDSEGRFFEAVEVKHGISITQQLVKDAYEKFNTTPVNRYYLLSTADICENEQEMIVESIREIKAKHGCQVIANGMIPTLKYYMRLLDDPCRFVENYVSLVEEDAALKFAHRKRWNKIIEEG